MVFDPTNWRRDILLGRHLIIDISPRDNTILHDNAELFRVIEQSLNVCNVKVERIVDKHFEPHGYSVYFMLSESHLYMHTWPEHNAICLDLFVCGDTDFDLFQSTLYGLMPYTLSFKRELERTTTHDSV